jgi:hypothetical protein
LSQGIGVESNRGFCDTLLLPIVGFDCLAQGIVMPVLRLHYHHFILAITLVALPSCGSLDAIKKGDIIGGILSAPFEVFDGALQTATAPLSGEKPQWIRDAEISNMRVGKPKINDQAWRNKFAKELEAGEVLLATFAENLSAYRYTKHDKYLSHAEQLVQTPSERSELDEAVLQNLGTKAFDASIAINGSATKPSYRDDKSKVLFISGEVRGATVHPTGSATLTLRKDLPFVLKDSYTVKCKFSFTIPRKAITMFLGMTSNSDRDSVGSVIKEFRFSPSARSGSCKLDFGTLAGATTVAVLGSRSAIQVTGSPYTNFEVTSITKD